VSRTETTSAGLAVTVVEPDGPSTGRVLYCLPGGGLSRRYFELDAPGWSMAEHLAERGHTVVTLDHPGVGESPAPADPWTLTPSVVADADADAIRELQQHLGGTSIGVGHSMGGMLTLTLQARHRLHSAIALLGYAHTDDYKDTTLAGRLTDEERSVLGDPAAIGNRLVALAKARFGEPLFQPPSDTGSTFLVGSAPIPADGRRALKRAASPLLACCGLASMLKCTIDDARALSVPVFVACGEYDIAGDFRSMAGVLASCPDITLFELPGAAHTHNVAPNRAALWDRLAAWATTVS
jgi:pimeloyl-ACP methyl ester carboxylesterase